MFPISLATSKGLALTRAFTRITDAKLRRSIVEMVEQIAAREDPTSARIRSSFRGASKASEPESRDNNAPEIPGRAGARPRNDKATNMLTAANPFDSKIIVDGIRRWVEIETPTEAPEQVNKLATAGGGGLSRSACYLERIAGHSGCGDHIVVRSSWGRTSRNPGT